ncbi:MAG: ParB/RepB/Spo0J family partition protein [Ruminococcus sp.]|uniref:ParB/RepB/Spo0J family partition protein n=1 Tax=Ruminococcus sp. TaxID=41978 RepID=UPI0025F7B7C4|nr:ParB/RepB/Spo0J family partition protein [Ruminococcus sp.]MBD9047430.1 ParB/RepB/Spo0J family partition protein [Ruminococcus sp.]
MTKNINININLLIPFENHPFKKRDGIEQRELAESIAQNGLLEPITVRSFPAGKYEIISGHRRVEACKELGITEVPATIKEMSRDEATIAMVDSNIHREHLLPSEKAFAYKMKLDAMKHQGKTYGQVVHKSRDEISDTESGRQIQRYIRLTYLIPELLKLVDDRRIAFTPAVELSFLSGNEQEILLNEIEYTDATPSLSQAQRLRKLSEEGNFFVDAVFGVLSEEKPNQKEQVRIPADKLRDILPKGMDKQKTEDFIIKACEHYRKYLIRQKNRDER